MGSYWEGSMFWRSGIVTVVTAEHDQLRNFSMRVCSLDLQTLNRVPYSIHNPNKHHFRGRGRGYCEALLTTKP